MGRATGHATSASQHPSLKAAWGPPQARQRETGMPARSSHAGTASPVRVPEGLPRSPAPSRRRGRFPGAAGASTPPRAPREPQHTPRLAGPGTLRPGAAEARGSPPAGRRADLDGAQRRAGCQAAPAPPAQPAPPRTGTSPPTAPQAGALKLATTGGWPQPGPRRDPRRPPAHTQPWAGRFPTPTSRQDCHPALRKASPAVEGSVWEAPGTLLPVRAPPHSQTAGKGAGTGSEQPLGCDGCRRGAKSIRVKESSATSAGTQDVQLVATC